MIRMFNDLEQSCLIERDRFGGIEDAYQLVFKMDESITTFRVVLNDKQSNSDLAITNMTVLPDSEQGKGYGSKAVAQLIEWAKSVGVETICAVQVGRLENEVFWERHGFTKIGNVTNDFLLVL